MTAALNTVYVIMCDLICISCAVDKTLNTCMYLIYGSEDDSEYKSKFICCLNHVVVVVAECRHSGAGFWPVRVLPVRLL